jgi:hypothetical protein
MPFGHLALAPLVAEAGRYGWLAALAVAGVFVWFMVRPVPSDRTTPEDDPEGRREPSR